MKEFIFITTTIPCKQCSRALEEELEEIFGVEMVVVDYETSKVKVYSNISNLDIDLVIQKIQDCGYRVKKIIK